MSQLTAVADPSELGLDPARLAAIDAFVAEHYLDTGRYPGMSLVIARGGKVAHVSHQGYADDAIFRIYSMSKPITSVALMQLYEQGRVKLSDSVSDYLPSWADLRVWKDGSPANYTTDFPEREMIVRDLLTHTSGLTYGWMGRHPVDALYRKSNIGGVVRGGTLAGMCDALAEVPLLFSPGTQWSYSVATDVCGHLVELVSGQPLDEYFSEHIFEPLGMVDTGFFVDDARADRLVPNYAHPELSPFGVPPGATGQMALIDDGGNDSPNRSKPTFFSGGGGLTSTLADYHRFTQMLLNGGALDGQRVIGRKTLEYATSNHLPNGADLAQMGQAVFSETTYEGVGFGLGFSVALRPTDTQTITSVGEFAWGGAASTMFWVDPAEELTVVGMTQLMPSSAYPIRQEMKALVYGALT
ncbi:MAG: serine hydrolase domain-containing protein [Acidimicrobiales bacterium]